MRKELGRDYPGHEIRSNKSIEKETGLKRRPDAAAVKDGKVVAVGEVVRSDDCTLPPREQKKVGEYKKKGIPDIRIKRVKKR